MTIKFYKNTAEENRIDKTSYITQVDTDVNGTLRSECNIIHPVIDIEYVEIPSFNYCYITEFGRYYFIDGITVVRHGLYRITMTEDVLMSYKGQKDVTPFTGLYGVNALLSRCGDVVFASMDKIDDRLPLSVKYNVSRSIINNNIFNIQYDPTAETKHCFLLCVANDPGIEQPAHPYPTGISPLVYPDPQHRTTSTSSSMYAMTKGMLRKLFQLMNTTDWTDWLTSYFGNCSEMVISCVAYPFDLLSIDGGESYPISDETIKIGNRTFTGVTGRLLYPTFNPIINIGSISVSREYHSFLDYEPYCEFEMFLPYVGMVNIPTSEVYETLSVKYAVDLATGRCKAYITAGVNRIISCCDGQLGVPVPILRSNAYELNNQSIQNALSIGISALTNNKAQFMGTAINVLQSQTFPTFKTEPSSIVSSQCEPSTVTLWKKWKSDVSDLDYNTFNGYPSTDATKIGNIDAGCYFEVDKIHIENLDGILSDEVKMLDEKLKSGVIA